MSLRRFFLEFGRSGFGSFRCGVLLLLVVSLRFDRSSFSRFSGGVEKRRLSFSDECSDDVAKGDWRAFVKFRKGFFMKCRDVA